MTNSIDWPNGASEAKESDEPDITSRLIDLIKAIPKYKQRQLLDWLNKWDLRGKRKHNRKSCLISVDYSTPERFYREFIQDISAGGLYIETREPLSKGDGISLTFSVPNSQVPIRVTGKIVRAEESGIAVEFKKISKYQEEIMSSLLKKM
ncbi:MAG: PilZ domain-containing protein [Deltaproteobacteria bacterium]|nr:PilZ domain-containing protein [Deltaproteobacteria bacterium]MBW2218649.1 PilZ domain-containing protein [Deltaproteobacteria bacterium]